MRKESKHVSIEENQWNTRDDSKRVKRDTKATRQIENNEQNGNSKSFPISNYFKCKWIKLTNQNTYSGWMDLKKPHKIQLYALQKTHFRCKGTSRLKVKVWNIFHAKGNQKRAEMALLISDKINFKSKLSKEILKGHNIMIKGWIHHEDTTSTHATNISASKYMKQTLTELKGEIVTQ